MLNILELTTGQQIRAVMGVSAADLEDVTLQGMALEDDLAEDLHGWLPEWEDVRDTGTDRQQRLLRMYAKYYVGALVAAAAPNFIIVKKSDGANVGELADIDLEGFNAIRETLSARAYSNRQKLLDDLSGETESSSSYAIMGRVIPTRDPVTTERS